MVTEHPITCPHCNKDTGFTAEQFMYCVLEHDLVCPHCGKIVIHAKAAEYWEGYSKVKL